MPRPVDTARRAQIARRAATVLEQRGVSGTTMSDIAAALGMKRPTLYWYFRDLDTLYEVVISELDAEFRTYITAQLGRVDHPLDLLGQLVQETMDFYLDRRGQLTLLVQLWVAFGAEGAAKIERRRRALVLPARELLITRIAEGIADGRVAPCDPAALVDLALAVIDGAQMHRVIREADPQAPIDAFRRYALAPLRLADRARPSRKKRRTE